MDPCQTNLDDLNRALERIMLGSHVLFIIGAVLAFTRKFYFLGTLFVLATFSSIIHHWNGEVCPHRGIIDTVIAVIFTAVISGYAIYDAIRNPPGMCMMSILLIGIFLLPPLFILARMCSPEEFEPTPVDHLGKKMKYRVFHLLWHIVGGMLAIFVIAVVKTDPLLDLLRKIKA